MEEKGPVKLAIHHHTQMGADRESLRVRSQRSFTHEESTEKRCRIPDSFMSARAGRTTFNYLVRQIEEAQ